MLAWEAGRKYGIRVNCISAGPLASRAAIAIKKVFLFFHVPLTHLAFASLRASQPESPAPPYAFLCPGSTLSFCS